MPRYFFHSEDGSLFCDEDGAELADEARAREEAIRLLGESLRQTPSLLDANGQFCITVADEAQRSLFTIRAQFERS